MTTFCWLPPLSVVIGASGAARCGRRGARSSRRRARPRARGRAGRGGRAGRAATASGSRGRVNVADDALAPCGRPGRAGCRAAGVRGDGRPRGGLRRRAGCAPLTAVGAGAGERVGQLVAARARAARRCRAISPSAHVEVDAAQDAGRARRAPRARRSRGARAVAARGSGSTSLADHQRRQRLRRRGRRRRAVRDHAAAAQDGDAVGDARRSRRAGATRRARSCRRARTSRTISNSRSTSSCGSDRGRLVEHEHAAAGLQPCRARGDRDDRALDRRGRPPAAGATSMSMPKRPMSARAVALLLAPSRSTRAACARTRGSGRGCRRR